ncbi:Heat stress transcription factor C-1-like protein [Drosera capensis]
MGPKSPGHHRHDILLRSFIISLDFTITPRARPRPRCPLPIPISMEFVDHIEMIKRTNDMAIAPFVAKTYQIVCDPSTDNEITWGGANNSFIVVEPTMFSSTILPSHFKHANFSSFVRQLNTYGFKKVDPDAWEFANQWFLRGQIHLLKHINRRHRPPPPPPPPPLDSPEMQPLMLEINRLTEDQIAMDAEIEAMARRIAVTERRPDQMVAFMCKVAEEPEMIPMMMIEKEKRRRLAAAGGGLWESDRAWGAEGEWAWPEMGSMGRVIGPGESSEFSGYQSVGGWLW